MNDPQVIGVVIWGLAVGSLVRRLLVLTIEAIIFQDEDTIE